MRRRSSDPWASATVCLLALAANGCSLSFAKGPPANHARAEAITCSSGYGLPITDTALAVGGAGLMFLALGAWQAQIQTGSSGTNPLWPIVAIPFVVWPGASAVYGYSTIASCRDAKAELTARRQARGLPPLEP